MPCSGKHFSARGSLEEGGASLTFFCFLWGATELFHLFSFRVWARGDVGPLLLLAAIALLLRPSSLFRFSLMAGLDVLHVAARSPMTANHIFFNGLVNLTIFLAVVQAFLRRGGQGIDRAALFREFAAPVRVELLVLYFITVLHKLNTDYLNPDISCGVHLLVAMHQRFPVLPVSEALKFFSIWGTLAVETAIPLFLCFPATRMLGIFLGWSFHTFLAFYPHAGIISFSAMLFALYALFLPQEFLEHVWEAWLNPFAETLRQSAGWRFLKRRWAFCLAGACLSGGMVLMWLKRGHSWLELYRLAAFFWNFVFLAHAILMMGLYASAYFFRRLRSPDEGRFFSLAFKSLWIMPLVVFLHSMSPYLGLKTVPCFSMFSNLRTEGAHPNHLFIPPALKIAHFQDDLVEVISSSNRELQGLADKKLLLPYFEFQRKLSLLRKPVKVEYLRAGKKFSLDNFGNKNKLVLPPVPWLLGKFLRFRPVDKEGPSLCRW